MILMSLKRHLAAGIAIAMLTGLTGCGPTIFEEKDGGPDRYVDINSIPNAVPRYEARSSYVNRPSYEVLGKRYHVLPSSEGFVERGIASWYGNKFHGNPTASGETYDMYSMTAAHKNLPLPTYVEVTNLENNRQIIVKVNDRGPFHKNRIIDLSYVAAAKLDITRNGTGLVEVRAINPAKPYTASHPTVHKDASGAADPEIFVQAGAFGVYDNALKMKTRLEQLNKPVRINKADINGQLIYRVQIGPVTGVEMADSIDQKLESLGIQNIKIVIE